MNIKLNEPTKWQKEVSAALGLTVAEVERLNLFKKNDGLFELEKSLRLHHSYRAMFRKQPPSTENIKTVLVALKRV